MSYGAERLQIVDNTLTSSSGNQIVLKKDGSDEITDHIVLYIQGIPDEESGLVQVVAEENGVQQLLTLDMYNCTLVNDNGEQPYKLYMQPPEADSNDNSGAEQDALKSTSKSTFGEEDSLCHQQSSKTKPEPDITLEFLAKARESLKSKDKQQTRKRRGYQLPQLHELLASPNFKLYVFNCKYCDYRCNAQKDLSNHVKNECQGRTKSSRARAASPGLDPQYTCTQCTFKCNTKRELTLHVEDKHEDHSPIEKATSHRSNKSAPKKNSSDRKFQNDSPPPAGGSSPKTVVVYMCSCCGLEGKSEADIIYHDCKELAKLKR